MAMGKPCNYTLYFVVDAHFMLLLSDQKAKMKLWAKLKKFCTADSEPLKSVIFLR